MPTGKKPPTPPDVAPATQKHMDALLDEALGETFPASDPVAIAFEKGRSKEGRHVFSAIAATGGTPSGRIAATGRTAAEQRIDQAERLPPRIEGYAIVSEDGMLADVAGIMPDLLKFEADQRFFERELDGADVVVHGRHSHERLPRSYLRHRLILTRKVPAIAADPANENALFWNPAGASFEQALAALEMLGGRVAVIGGTDVFGMFLDRYDVFHLSRAPDVRLPGGRPVFPEVPMRTPEEVLASHGLERGQRQVFDSSKGVAIVSWGRSSTPGR